MLLHCRMTVKRGARKKPGRPDSSARVHAPTWVRTAARACGLGEAEAVRRLGAWERDVREAWDRAADAGTWPELRVSSWVLWDRVIGRRHLEAFLRGEDRAWIRGRGEIGDPVASGTGRGLTAEDLAARDLEIGRLLVALQAWVDRWPREGATARPSAMTYPERVAIRGALLELEVGRPVLEIASAEVDAPTPPEVTRRHALARRIDRRLEQLVEVATREARSARLDTRRRLGWAAWLAEQLSGLNLERVIARARR